MFFDGQHLLPGAKLVYADSYINACVLGRSNSPLLFLIFLGRQLAATVRCLLNIWSSLFNRESTAVVESQLRTVPPYLVGALWSVLFSYYSYRRKERAVPIILSCLLMIVGYSISIGTKETHARYEICIYFWHLLAYLSKCLAMQLAFYPSQEFLLLGPWYEIFLRCAHHLLLGIDLNVTVLGMGNR